MDNNNLGFFLSNHYRKIVLIVGVIFAVCVLGLAILLIVQNLPQKTYISVNVAPSDATVSINGQEYRNGTYEIAPGQYTANISAEGFTAKSFPITVVESSTTQVATFLVNDKEGMAYYEKSSADLQILNSLTDLEAQEFMKTYNQKISIRNYMPVIASYDMSDILDIPGNEIYEQTVTDGSNNPACQQAFCLLVSGYQYNEAALRQALSELGYNLDDYEVIYEFSN